jgi:hypothetical protein
MDNPLDGFTSDNLSPEENARQLALLGDELEKAAFTSLYRFLMRRASLSKDDATNALRTADPTDWRVVARHQADADRFDQMMRWINEAISTGHAAAQQAIAAYERDDE